MGKRLVALGVNAALAAIGFGLLSGAPASASTPAPATAVVQEQAAASVIAGWKYYFTYFTLAECQSVGEELVYYGYGTDYYCDQIYVSGYVMWRLYYWVD